MSVLYSIIPDELVFATEDVLPERRTMEWEGMLVEVVVSGELLVLNRLIDAPLYYYLDERYLPGTIIDSLI